MTDDLTDRFDQLLRHQTERDRAYAWPVEHDVSDRASRDRARAEYRPYLAVDQDPAVVAGVLAAPDADAPRRAYAAWHRARGTDVSRAVADFVDGQLAIAAALRADPDADVAAAVGPYAHAFAERDLPRWWRYPEGGPTGLAGGLAAPLAVLADEGLVANLEFHRGFVEHVAMRASRFLEIADELFALAPIRHLTLTYCKGPEHDNRRVLEAVLASPHLARIRSLQFPGRVLGNNEVELNHLTDADLARIAASPYLAGLTYLRFVDQPELSATGLGAITASGRLPALRVLRHELFRYARTAGDYGDHVSELAYRLDVLPAIDSDAAIEATATATAAT